MGWSRPGEQIRSNSPAPAAQSQAFWPPALVTGIRLQALVHRELHLVQAVILAL